MITTLALFLFACGGGGSQTSADKSVALAPESIEYNNFISFKYGIAFRYPKGWLDSPISDDTGEIEVIAAYHELSDRPDDLFYENIGFFVSDQSSPSSASRNRSAKLKTVETIGNHEAVVESGTIDVDLGNNIVLKLSYITFTTDIGEKYFTVQYIGELQRFNTYTKVARSIFESLKIGTKLVVEHDNEDRSLIVKSSSSDNSFVIAYCSEKDDLGKVAISTYSRLGVVEWTQTVSTNIPMSEQFNCEHVAPEVIFDGSDYIVAYNALDPESDNPSLFYNPVSIDGTVGESKRASDQSGLTSVLDFGLQRDANGFYLVWMSDTASNIETINYQFFPLEGEVQTGSYEVDFILNGIDKKISVSAINGNLLIATHSPIHPHIGTFTFLISEGEISSTMHGLGFPIVTQYLNSAINDQGHIIVQLN